MLQSIRDHAQGWLAWIIIIILGLLFAFWGIARLMTGGGSGSASQTIATINGQSITSDQFNITYERLKRQLELESGNNFVINQQVQNKLKQQTLKMLVTNQVLTEAALDAGYRITPDQIDTVLASMPLFQVNGQFSNDRFATILNALMYTESAFLAQLQSDMLLNQLQVGLVATAFALPNEVNNVYRLINQTRDVQYVIIPLSKFSNNVTVNPAMEQAFYKKQQNLFKIPEQVSISYIELSLAQIQAGLKFTDAQLQQYYQSNTDNFSSPAQWQIAHILVKVPVDAHAPQVNQAQAKIVALEKQLKDGANFADVAKKNSDDILSAKQGGELPWFNTGALGDDIQNALTKLKPGEFSKPIKTQYGFEIIKLIAQKPQQVEPFAKVRAQVQTMLAQEKAQELFANQSDQLSDLTYTNSDNLTAAASALHLTINTTPLFSRNGSKTGITSNSKVIAAAFSQSVLTEGNNSDVIQLDPNTQVVIRVQEHKPAAIKPFTEVQSEINAMLKKQEAEKQAQTYGQTLLQKIQQGADIQTLTSSDNLSLEKFAHVGRHDDKLDTLLLETAFDLARPSTANGVTSQEVQLPNGDYAVVMVTGVYDGNSANISADEKTAYQQQIAANYGHLDFELYVRQQMANSKIKIDQSAVQQQMAANAATEGSV